MYAVIEDSGRQYKVEENSEIHIDLREADPGDTIEFQHVVALGDKGTVETDRKTLESCKVAGTVEAVEKGDKIIVGKFKRRKKIRRKQGHRHTYLRVRITGISK